MGLLDSIFSNPSFIGGLLGRDWQVDPNQTPIADFLLGKQQQSGASGVDESGFSGYLPQAAQAQQQQPSVPPMLPQGGPSSFGSYGGVQYPVFGNSPPSAVALPAGAQPVQYQPQQPQQQSIQRPAQSVAPQSPGIGDRLSAGLQGFAYGSAPIPAIANLIGGLASGQRQDPVGIAQQNQLLQARAISQALQARGMPSGQADNMGYAISTDAKLGETILPQALGMNPPKTTNEFAARVAAGEKFPGMEGGSGIQRAMQVEGALKANDAAAQKRGEAQGTAQAALPATLDHFDQSIQTIDELLKDPDLKYGFGLLGLTGKVPGTAAANVQAKVGQVSGEASMLGLQQLRSLGRINQNEFMAGTKAVTTLQTSQSEPAAREALAKLRGVFVRAREQAGVLAGGEPTPSPLAKPAQSGLPQGWSVQVR